VTTYKSRADWGARLRRGYVSFPADRPIGVACHWPGTTTKFRGASAATIASALRGWQNYHMDVKGWSDIAYCLPTSVEALTDSGWKRPEQITQEDRLYTLNPETQLGEWQNASAINIFRGPRQMLRDADGLLSTANHRWPVRQKASGKIQFVTTERLLKHHTVPVSAPSADQPTDAKYTDDFVALVAWFWTEGHVMKSRGKPSNCVAIYQSHTANPQYVQQINATLTRLFGPESPFQRDYGRAVCGRGHELTEDNIYTRPNGRQICRTCWIAQSRLSLEPIEPAPRWSIRRTGNKTTFFLNAAIGSQLRAVAETSAKVIRRDFLLALTPAQLDMFIAVSISADGYTPQMGGPVLAQKERARAEAFAFACVLAGRGVTITEVPAPAGKTTMHAVTIKTRTTVIPARNKPERVAYDGDVWCPTTPNGTWFARHNGRTFFTGNSVGIDWAGRCWELRGVDVRTAANGSTESNRDYTAALWILGIGEQPTEAQIQAFRDWRSSRLLAAHHQAAAVKTHNDVRPSPTECPGPAVTALVRSGTLLRPGGPTTDWFDDVATEADLRSALRAELAGLDDAVKAAVLAAIGTAVEWHSGGVKKRAEELGWSDVSLRRAVEYILGAANLDADHSLKALADKLDALTVELAAVKALVTPPEPELPA